MIMFWIVAAALAITALLFVGLPLWKRPVASAARRTAAQLELAVYRDQMAELIAEHRCGRLSAEQYAQARVELENRLLDEAAQSDGAATAPPVRRQLGTAVLASVAIPLLAIPLYLGIGNPGAMRAQPNEGAHGLGQPQLDAMVARLAARLQANPQDARGWVMLARAQTVLGRFNEARAAYAKAVEIFPEDAQLLADYADAMAMAQGGNLRGEPEKLIERAMHADPGNAKALALAGTVAFDGQDYALAIKLWERLRGAIPQNSEFAKSIQSSIDEAKSLAARKSNPGRAKGASVVAPSIARR